MADANDRDNPAKPTPIRPAMLDDAAAGTYEIEQSSERSEQAALPSESVRTHSETPRAAADPFSPPPAPPARAKRPVSDAPLPCGQCGYDLRGLPAGRSCPECGSSIPKRLRVQLSRSAASDQLDLRMELAGCWRTLASASLAPIVLMSPIPYLLPFGIAMAVATGLAPGFRIVALRKFRNLVELPEAGRPATALAQLAAEFRVGIKRLLIIAFVELTLASIVVLALWGTFGSIPAAIKPLYPFAIVAWWMVAMGGVVSQLRIGAALAARLRLHSTSNAEEPSITRVVLMARIALGTGILGVAMLINGAAIGPSNIAVLKVLAGFTLPVFMLAALIGAWVCLKCASHANYVAESVFSCDG